MGETVPKVPSPLQSFNILLARVVFPAFGGPYSPILALFFLKILFIQAPRFSLKLLMKPISYLRSDKAHVCTNNFP
jgi:hypothetical protein